MRASSMQSMPRMHSPASRTGFTLIEVLVSMGVIAVLMAISLPALLGARRQAERIELLANQRESLLLIFGYAHDHDDKFPSFGVERTNIAPLEWHGQVVADHWWNQIEYWGLFLQTRGYDGWVTAGPRAWPTVFDTITCAGCGQGKSEHLLTAAAWADPRLFVPEGADDTQMHVVQSLDRVKYPSDKGLIVHLRSFAGNQPVAVAFADGHVAAVLEASLLPGAEVDMAWGGMPVVITLNGLRGRDQ